MFYCAHCQTPMPENAAVAETAPGQIQAVSYCKVCGAYVWSAPVPKERLLTDAGQRESAPHSHNPLPLDIIAPTTTSDQERIASLFRSYAGS